MFTGPDVSSTLGKNCNTVGETGVDDTVIECVTQVERQKLRRREYQREYQCEYRKRKKDCAINTKGTIGSKSCNFINNFFGVNIFCNIILR